MKKNFIYGILGIFFISLITLSISLFDNNSVYAKNQKTISESFEQIGDFVKKNPNYLYQVRTNLKKNDLSPEETVATVNNLPISIAEVEFRKGLNNSAGFKYRDYTDMVNILVEEKLVLDYCAQNNILPTDKDVENYIEIEKGYYDDPNLDHKKMVDEFCENTGLSLEEYWNIYEWYNVYRLLALDNTCKDVIAKAKDAGKLPKKESALTQEDIQKEYEYWKTIKKELKNNANIKINDKFSNLMITIHKNTLYSN